jgi:hypothetical protein
MMSQKGIEPMPTKVIAVVVAGLILMLGGLGSAAAPSVLFIGNSFTFGEGSPVHFYRADSVADLNGEGIGGMPALFRSFANQAGLDFDVALETHPGAGLDYHLESRKTELTSRPWDTVVMHGYSTLDRVKAGDPAKLVETASQMAALLRERNPKVAIWLMATWSRADQTYPPAGAWAGKPIEAMAHDVRAGYDLAAAKITPKGVLPVGEAWTRAIQTGVADANPYDGIEAGKLDLWTWDHYHASTAGYYLEALVVFGSLTGRDPRSLGDVECSGYELGLPRTAIKALEQVAFDQLTAAGIAMTAGEPARKLPGRCAAAPTTPATTAGR